MAAPFGATVFARGGCMQLQSLASSRNGKRSTMRFYIIALLLAGAAICGDAGASACWANDSSAELSIGGLVFTKNSDVSIQSEDLTITPDNVTVRYVFLNESPNPVTLTVAFPLPDIDLADGANVAFPVGNPVNFVGFSTKVDGKAINFTVNQRAFLNNKDVTATLRSMGIPLLPIGPAQLKITELSQQIRDRAVNEGLVLQSGNNDKGEPLYEPTWVLKTSVVRQQTFPPGKPVTVEHRYRTSVGLSFDSVLRQGLRQSKALDSEVQRYKANYCIPDDFLKSLDRLAGADEANKGKILERRISYVLKTGANWAGPIKDFHLVVDKGQPDRLVSFCGDGVKKISPTAFEVRAKDFTPTQNLNIILLGRK
jgi:hypothetical protein